MADVVRPIFGRKRARLTGFIPADLGRDALEKRRAADLFAFAKMGQPPIISGRPNHPETFTPDDRA